MDRDCWWRSAVIYQIYPSSFFDSNGDGVGDLPGVIEKLDHIASLNVDAIWLSPFFVSPQADFGYDVADYEAVDPLFGTLDDFDRLTARAKQLGLKVLIDQVWSHTSVEHAWFAESRVSPTGPRANWYVWADPSIDGTPPNNWLSVFGGSAWTWEPRRRQFYLHHFLSSQPQLNLRNPEVRQALLASGRFWLERGVDGFRLDAVDFYMHDPALRSNPAQPCTSIPTKPFGMQQHVHDMLHDDALQFMREIRALTDEYPGTTTIAEVSSQDGAFTRVHRYTSAADLLCAAYTLRLTRMPFTADAFRAMLDEVAPLLADGSVCWSFNNHDVERAITRWGCEDDPRFARLLMALLLSLPGPVCLYQGEELGLTESKIAFEDLRDPFGITYYPQFRGRDGSRTPLPWNGDAPHAGFTTADRAWLPVPAEHRTLAVDRAEREPRSILHTYRQFLAWRRAQPDLIGGRLMPAPTPGPVVAFWRGSTLCMFNFSEQTQYMPADGFASLQGHGLDADLERGIVQLPPYGVFFGRRAEAKVAAASATVPRTSGAVAIPVLEKSRTQ